MRVHVVWWFVRESWNDARKVSKKVRFKVRYWYPLILRGTNACDRESFQVQEKDPEGCQVQRICTRFFPKHQKPIERYLFFSRGGEELVDLSAWRIGLSKHFQSDLKHFTKMHKEEFISQTTHFDSVNEIFFIE